MTNKSNHKQAWQTAQRALQAARNAEALALTHVTSHPEDFRTAARNLAPVLRRIVFVG